MWQFKGRFRSVDPQVETKELDLSHKIYLMGIIHQISFDRHAVVP
jgi:hypothetical protein